MFITVFLVLFVIAEIGFFLADRYILSFVLIAANLLFAYFFVPEFAAYIASHGFMSIFTEVLPVYLVIGAGVAFVKWFLFLFKRARKLNECKQKYPSESRADFISNWNCNYYSYGRVSNSFKSGLDDDDYFFGLFTPKAKDEADRITFWVLQWPLVIVATILEDFLIKLGKHIAELFDSLFSGLAKKIIGNSLKGL